MKISVNGEVLELNASITINDLIHKLEIIDKVAVELNQEIIPRSQFTETYIQSDDQIEIVRAIGGG